MAETTTLSAEIRISKPEPKTGALRFRFGLKLKSKTGLLLRARSRSAAQIKLHKTKLQTCDERIKINLRAHKMYTIRQGFWFRLA